MAKSFLILASVLGLTATGMGALTAHALRERLPDASLRTLETAVHYQFWHALALLAVATLLLHWPGSRLLHAAGLLFGIGVILFCGSLYLLGMTELRHIGPLPIGPVTPLGGLCLIAGWAALGTGAWKLL